MPSNYLQSADYATYGVPNATASQVLQASATIDSFTQRNEGLIYVPDGNGVPCYMFNLSPTYTLTTNAVSITAGSNVVVTVTGPIQLAEVGKPLILDRANTMITEAVIIAAISGNTLTLTNVQFNHDINVTLDSGLVIEELHSMPDGRPITTLRKSPVCTLIAGRGRYGYGRRGNADNSTVNEYNLLAAVTEFGGPPIWESWKVSMANFNRSTGEAWIPAGILIAYYTETEIHYVSGFTYTNLPSAIKLACANIITSISNAPVSGSFKSISAGGTSMTRFDSSQIDSDTKGLLMPYCARGFV